MSIVEAINYMIILSIAHKQINFNSAFYLRKVVCRVAATVVIITLIVLLKYHYFPNYLPNAYSIIFIITAFIIGILLVTLLMFTKSERKSLQRIIKR